MDETQKYRALPWSIAHVALNNFFYMWLLAVAVLRALAETAYFPWLQEFVPNAVRGKYGAVNTVLTMLTAMIALGVAGQVIGRSAGLSQYMLLIGLGSGIGLFAVGLMAFVPGGRPVAEQTARPPLANLRLTLQDRNFVYFLAGMGSYSVGVYMLAGFLPLYLTEQIGLQPGAAVSLEMASMLGGAVASLLAGVIADRVGSRPVMMPGLALSVLIPLGWLGLSADAPGVAVWSGVLYFAYGAFANGASIAAIRLLFNSVIPLEKNTEYTAIYYAWAGLTGGSAPLLAGWLLATLSGWQANAYRLVFVLVLLGFGAAVYFYGQVKPDSPHSTRSVWLGWLARFRLERPGAHRDDM